MVNKSGNIESVTLLRGIAALGVCFVHFYVINGVVYSPPVDRLFFMGQLGVTVFFVLSGFILPYSLFRKKYSLSGFPQFLLKRSVRIDLPYWATIILLFVSGAVPLESLNFKSALLHLFYIVPFFKGQDWFSGVFWTLTVEFQYYIILGLLFPLLIKMKPILSVALVLSASIICIMLKFNMRELILSWLHNFAVGYIVFLYFAEKISMRLAIIIVMVFCAFLGLSISIITGLVPALTALFILLYQARCSKVLLFLGNISYSLYLTHFTVIYFGLAIIKAYITNAFLLCIISIGVSVAFAYIFNMLFERPALRLSKKIRLSFKPAVSTQTQRN